MRTATTPSLLTVTDGEITSDMPGAFDFTLLNTILGNGMVTLTGGMHDLAALTTFKARMTITGGSIPLLTNLSTLENASLFLVNGAVLNLPLITALSHNENRDNTLSADGAGSRLIFPNVATIVGSNGNSDDFFFRATNGGRVEIPNMTEVTSGAVLFDANGSDSLIDLTLLESFTGNLFTTSSGFSATNGGRIVTPALTHIIEGEFTSDALGNLDYAQLESYIGVGTLNLSGGNYNLSSLSNFSGRTTSSGGSHLTFSLITVISHTANSDKIILADGPESRISFPNVTTIIGPNGNSDELFVRALNGGRVDLPALTEVTSGAVLFVADGANSLVDLTLLETFTGKLFTTTAGFRSTNSGTILTPVLTSIHEGEITSDSPTNIDLSLITSITGDGKITLTGGVHDLTSLVTMKGRLYVSGLNVPVVTSLTSIDGASIYVSDGAILNLPLITSYVQDDNNSNYLRADGNGSQLNLSNLTDIATNNSTSRRLYFEAWNGGEIDLSSVDFIDNPTTNPSLLQFDADGIDSRIDLTSLTMIDPTDAQFFETNGGVIFTPGLDASNLPDLDVLGLTSSLTNLTPNTVVSLTWNVKNSGGVDFNGTRRDSIFLANNPEGSGAIRLTNFNINSLLVPTATESITRNVTIPQTGYSGTVYLIVRVDEGLKFIEPNETNNDGATSALTLPQTLTLNVNRDEISEVNDGTATGYLSRNGDTSTPLTVDLSASPNNQVTLPASITFNAGQNTRSFSILPINDQLPDGDSLVTVSAQAAGFTSGQDSLLILDGSVPALEVSVDNSAPTEGDTVTLTITRNKTAGALATTLSASQPNQATFTNTLTFLDGEASISTALNIIDDDTAEQDALLRIVAAASGYLGDSSDLTVIDNDQPNLTLTLNRTVISEAAGPGELLATITRETATSEALLVNLTGSSPATFEATGAIFIPANQTSVSIPLTPVDNDTVEGDRTITLWARSFEANSGDLLTESPVLSLDINDDDGPALSLAFAKKILLEGDTTSMTITRNVVDANPLTVTLSHGGDDRVSLTSAITIPANQASTSTILTLTDNGETDGTEDLEAIASGTGYASGSSSLTISDETLPELLISRLDAIPEVNTNETGTFSYRISNLGGQATNSLIEIQTFLSRDQSVGEGDELIDEYAFEGNIPAGLYFERSGSFIAPLQGGPYFIISRVDPSDTIEEILENNNSSVRVIDTLSNSVVAEGMSDINGQASFTDLSEGYYEVIVSAEKHSSFRNIVFIDPGETNTVRAFLERTTVEYIWNVVPTSIEDEYRIVIETVFETNVPVPVVTIEPAHIDLSAITQEVTNIDITITNHGLIGVEGLSASFDSTTDWQMMSIAEDLGNLPAKSSITIPVTIIDMNYDGSRTSGRAGGCPGARLRWNYECGDTYIARGGRVSSSGGGCGGSGSGGSAFPGGGVPNGGGINSRPSGSNTPCDPCLAQAIGECILSFVPGADIPLCVRGAANAAASSDPVEAAQAALSCACAIVDLVPPAGVACNLINCYIDILQCAEGEGAGVGGAGRASVLGTPAFGSFDQAGRDLMTYRDLLMVTYYAAGVFEIEDLDPEMNDDFATRSAFQAAGAAYLAALDRAQAAGYGGLIEAYLAKQTELFSFLTVGDGVCARVRLRIEQEAVMTRDAFEASLEIINSDPAPLEDLNISISIIDANGADQSALFGIDGNGASNATLNGETNGNWSWTIIPTSLAAPTGPVEYFVKGTVSFMQGDFLVETPLAPQSITVQPSPSLKLKYFHERDVFSDDPDTTIIEPSIPFSLGVMVQNEGAGLARNLRITSAQPVIVDNEKGLFIDFDIIASEVSGQSLTPSLTADFGDIQPGEIKIGQWLMKSSLQGLFTEYKASFEHLNSLGDERLSLIKEVTIHETMQSVSAPGTYQDNLPDFLVNDIPDFGDTADTVHLSDGSVAPVTFIPTGAALAPNPLQLEVTLTIDTPSGFLYAKIDDPGDGNFRLVNVVRSDGRVLPLDVNAWSTDRTFIGLGLKPVRENKLHLFDHDTTGSYTLTYVQIPPADTEAPSSSVAMLPIANSGFFSVDWSGTDNTAITGFDIYVSENSGPFILWLDNSNGTSALFEGTFGNDYAFHSIASDAAGNNEVPKSTGEASTSVSLVNQAPVLDVIADTSITEGQTLRITATASDSDGPNSALRYSLTCDDPGVTINATSGRIRWITNENNGGQTVAVTVTVTDGNSPPASTSSLFSVTVIDDNKAPSLGPFDSVVLEIGEAFAVTAIGTDPDAPAQVLTYTIVSAIPTGLTLDSATGEIQWTPLESQGDQSFAIEVAVSDDQTPPLSASRTLLVEVLVDPGLPPVFDPFPAQIWSAATTHFLDLHAEDPEGEPISFTADFTGLPGALLLEELPTPGNTRLHWQTFDAPPGVYTIPVTASTDRQSTTALITIEIQALAAFLDYQGWVNAYMIPSGQQGQSSGSPGVGISNLLSYGLGIDPIGGISPAQAEPRPVAIISPTNSGLSFQLPSGGRPDLRYIVQTTTDLETWETIGTKEGKLPWNEGSIVNEDVISPNFSILKVLHDTGLDDEDRRFMRLIVQEIE